MGVLLSHVFSLRPRCQSEHNEQEAALGWALGFGLAVSGSELSDLLVSFGVL